MLASLTAQAAADAAPVPDAAASTEPQPDRIVHRSDTWTDAPAADRDHSRVLHVRHFPQQDPAWDWVAAAATVTDYYGRRYTQEQLCNMSRQPLRSPCPKRDGDLHDVQRILDNTGFRGSRLLTQGLTFGQLRAELDAGRPVLLQAESRKGALSHTIVVHGYNAKQKWVYWTDSWPSAPRYSWADFDLLNNNPVFRVKAALVHVGPGRSADRQPPVRARRAVVPVQGSNIRPRSSTGRILDIDMQEQERNQWCWAASGDTVADFWHRAYTQTQFCNLAFGKRLDENLNDPSCPNLPNDLGADSRAFSTMGLNGGRTTYGPMSFEEIKEEIDAGRPVITRIGWKRGGGHIEVIFGYDERGRQIFWGDPWFTSYRYNWAPFAYYVDNASFSWTYALKGVSEGTLSVPAL
ncbi:hypothetical protein A6A06_22275 [Streptomyces sp. CB02923]|nr:hypothetical protein A6A06_22275 [Streptomyces sp. CB02923]